MSFDIICKEFAIEFDEAMMALESTVMTHKLTSMTNNTIFLESDIVGQSDMKNVRASENKSFMEKVKGFIEKVFESIRKFIQTTSMKIKKLVLEKNYRKKIESLKNMIAKNRKLARCPVTIHNYQQIITELNNIVVELVDIKVNMDTDVEKLNDIGNQIIDTHINNFDYLLSSNFGCNAQTAITTLDFEITAWEKVLKDMINILNSKESSIYSLWVNSFKNENADIKNSEIYKVQLALIRKGITAALGKAISSMNIVGRDISLVEKSLKSYDGTSTEQTVRIKLPNEEEMSFSID